MAKELHMEKRILAPMTDGSENFSKVLAVARQARRVRTSGAAVYERGEGEVSLPDDPHGFVSTDTASLASHMNTCKQSQGRFFLLRLGGDVVRVLVSSRIVSTGTLLGGAGVAVLLYFA